MLTMMEMTLAPPYGCMIDGAAEVIAAMKQEQNILPTALAVNAIASHPLQGFVMGVDIIMLMTTGQEMFTVLEVNKVSE